MRGRRRDRRGAYRKWQLCVASVAVIVMPHLLFCASLALSLFIVCGSKAVGSELASPTLTHTLINISCSQGL